MTDIQQPEALRLANVCSNLTRYSMDAHLIAAELRTQHAEIETLRAGYSAARLESAALRKLVQDAPSYFAPQHDFEGRKLAWVKSANAATAGTAPSKECGNCFEGDKPC